MKNFFKNNSLSITFVLLFLFSLIAQAYFGYHEHNKELNELGAASISANTYLRSGHFLQSTFENWESEFLQMALIVILTIFLKQKGSSESKSFDKKEAVDREPSAKRKDAPWPVKRGGVILKIYEHSLSITLFLLFIISFVIHFYGSLKDENEQEALKKLSITSWHKYITSARFWFESFQNWQSEFLSVFAIIVLSIYLREKGSPQSKPVDASHQETGE
jgi:hypothetical protein